MFDNDDKEREAFTTDFRDYEMEVGFIQCDSNALELSINNAVL